MYLRVQNCLDRFENVSVLVCKDCLWFVPRSMTRHLRQMVKCITTSWLRKWNFIINVRTKTTRKGGSSIQVFQRSIWLKAVPLWKSNPSKTDEVSEKYIFKSILLIPTLRKYFIKSIVVVITWGSGVTSDSFLHFSVDIICRVLFLHGLHFLYL